MTQVVVCQHVLLEGCNVGGPDLANDQALGLNNKAAVSTNGALANDGNIRLDTNAGDGGSSLTLAGALTNSGSLTIGNATLYGSDKVTAAGLDNTGAINLTGFRANQALLDVSGSPGFGTAEVLSGHVQLVGDSAIEFTGGQIATIAAGSGLTLSGKGAVIEDSTALGSNSALTGLSNVSGALNISGGASLSVAGALTNNGSLQLGDNQGGLSTLSVAGALTNTGSLDLNDGTSSDILTVGALSNSGSIFCGIDYPLTNQALLDVTTGVAGFGTPGILTGSVNLQFGAAIEFMSGQISTIATGATLELFGTSSLIEDSTALGSNSARAGRTRQRLGVSLSRRGLRIDDGVAHRERHCRPRQPLLWRRLGDHVGRRRADGDRHGHAGHR